MPETLPMLEKDPRGAYKTSRGLRALAFSTVAAIILVSVLVVTVRFLWDEFLRHPLNMGPYEPNPYFLLPAMALIAGLLAKMIWDAAEGRTPQRRRK